MALGHGTHHRAHGQAVEIVVHKDHNAQDHGHQLRAGAGLDVLLGPAAEGSGAAALVHQVHHDAQLDQEDDDTDVPAIRQHRNQTGIGANQRNDRIPGAESGDHQGASQAAEEQRGIDLLADQRQSNGYQRREQRPCRTDYAIGVRNLYDDQQHDDDAEGYAIGNFRALLFHCEINLLQ